MFIAIIKKLSEFTISDYEDEEKQKIITTYFAIIKTLSVTLHRTRIEELKQKLLFLKNEENKIIIDNVINILNKNGEEKNKHKVVSMVRTRN